MGQLTVQRAVYVEHQRVLHRRPLACLCIGAYAAMTTRGRSAGEREGFCSEFGFHLLPPNRPHDVRVGIPAMKGTLRIADVRIVGRNLVQCRRRADTPINAGQL